MRGGSVLNHDYSLVPNLFNVFLHATVKAGSGWGRGYCDYTFKSGVDNPHDILFLCRASFDSTIRLWELEKGACLHTLKKHDDPVYSVSFSPDGKYLASGSFDKWIYIWSTSDGSIIKQYKGSSGIFEVCWNKDGSKLAASLANNTVSLQE